MPVKPVLAPSSFILLFDFVSDSVLFSPSMLLVLS